VQIVVALGTFSLKSALGGILGVFCYSLPSASILLGLGLVMREYKYEGSRSFNIQRDEYSDPDCALRSEGGQCGAHSSGVHQDDDGAHRVETGCGTGSDFSDGGIALSYALNPSLDAAVGGPDHADAGIRPREQGREG
jgi:hypothetical protein